MVPHVKVRLGSGSEDEKIMCPLKLACFLPNLSDWGLCNYTEEYGRLISIAVVIDDYL